MIDVAVFVGYTLTVVLHEPAGFTDLVTGIYRGPSQILTFALPLVSPRTLIVAPVALTWLAGTVAGECIARRWTSVLPYTGFLVAFGLAYAGTQRAAGSDSSARLRETVLAGGLLATLLLLRSAQAWVHQDESAESTQADGVLPLRGMAIGAAVTAVVVLAASVMVQSSVFPKRSAAPQRVPSIDNSKPLAPIPFVSELRPRTSKDAAPEVFSVTVDRPVAGYFGIANVDFYDGSGWSFNRTFRPSGGVLPADADPALRTSGRAVNQSYRISAGPLSSAPWMPTLYRASKVTGTAVDIDAGSGMIVPANALSAGMRYTVRSAVPQGVFAQLKANLSTPDTATPAIDTQIPGTLSVTLGKLIESFAAETGTPSSPALPFLQALQKDLTAKYSLSSAAQGIARGTRSPAAPTTATPSTSLSRPDTSASPRHSSHAGRVERLAATSKPTKSARSTRHPNRVRSSPRRKPAATTTRVTPTPTPTSSASTTSPSADRAGGTSFADVLASILGPQRSGTPEQFATLIALIARALGVPARVATGFRVTSSSGTAAQLTPGNSYRVTTADAWTWTEVPIVGRGWVVLDASPGEFSAQDQQPNAGAAPSPSSSKVPSQNALITRSNGGHAIAKKSSVPHTAAASRRGLLVALLIALAALSVALLFVLASRKRIRAARRRRNRDPRGRLLGAWRESIDMLVESGLPELSTMTSAEIATLTGEQFGSIPGAQVVALGEAANAAAYSVATVIAPAEADAAWVAQRTLRRSVRHQLSISARMAAALRYHRRARAEPQPGPASWVTSAAATRLSEQGAAPSPQGRGKYRLRRYQGRRRR